MLEEQKPKMSMRSKVTILLLVLLVVGLGVTFWTNKQKLGSSAATMYPSQPPAGLYVPGKDVVSDNWVPTPATAKGNYYTLVDELTPNQTDYITTKSTGSDDLVFDMKSASKVVSPTISQLTVELYTKSGALPGVKSSLAVNISINGNWQQAQVTTMGWEIPPAWTVKSFRFRGKWTPTELSTLKVKITGWEASVVDISVSAIQAKASAVVTSPTPEPSHVQPNFLPEDTVSRALLAETLANAYGKSANPATPSFTDVPKEYWAFNSIEGLKAAGIMSGYSDGTFKPEQGTTRADATTAVAKAAAVAPYDNPTPSFTDVPKTHLAYQYIEGMKRAGFINGYSDGTFRPEAADTRATLAVFLFRAKNLLTGCDGRVFADVPSTYWACKEIVGVSEFHHWMPFCPSGGFSC